MNAPTHLGGVQGNYAFPAKDVLAGGPSPYHHVASVTRPFLINWLSSHTAVAASAPDDGTVFRAELKIIKDETPPITKLKSSFWENDETTTANPKRKNRKNKR